MTALAMQYLYGLMLQLNGVRLFGEDLRITEAFEDAIRQFVGTLSQVELIQLIWESEGIDGDLLGGDVESNDPREMVGTIAELCLEQAALELSGYFERRRQSLQAAKTRRSQRDRRW